MFSVYGVTGRQFTGSAEQLRQIERVSATARPRRVDSHESELPERVSADPARLALSGGMAQARRQALSAYAQPARAETQRQPLTRVAEIMQTPALTLPQDTPVLQAWRLLSYHGYAQAPVVDAGGTLVGLVLRGELLQPERLGSAELDAQVWRQLMEQPIAELMWTPVPSCSAEHEIRRVAAVLADHGLPGLPVTDDGGQVTGFVSRGDIVRAVAHEPPLDLWS